MCDDTKPSDEKLSAEKAGDGRMFTNAQRAKLRAPIAGDGRIKVNFGGFRYLPMTRLIHSLNGVFGEGMWSDSFVFREMVYSDIRETLDKQGNKIQQHVVQWACGVRLTVRDGFGHEVTHEDVAVADSYQGVDNGLGPNHHMALSGAYSTALKRCARKFGNFLGASLLDKDDPLGERSGEFVARINAESSGTAAPELPKTDVPVAKPGPPQSSPKPTPPPSTRPPLVVRMRQALGARLDEFYALQLELHGAKQWPYALAEAGISDRAEIGQQGDKTLAAAGQALTAAVESMKAELVRRRTA